MARWSAGCGAALLTLIGCGDASPGSSTETAAAAGSTAEGDLRALPDLDLTSMEAPVRELLAKRVAAVSAAPSSADAWAKLGFALDAHMLLEEAEAALARSLELDAGAFEAAYDFAFVGTLLERSDGEITRRFEAAAALRPSYAPVFARLGDHLLQAGDTRGAATRYRAALDVFAAYDYARLGLSRAQLVDDDPSAHAAAAAALRGLFERFPGDGATATALGQALALTGDIDGAAKIAEEHAAARERGDTAGVPIMDSLRVGILALSRTAAASFQRGESALRRGDLAAAATELERVLAADEGNRTARLMLAKTLVGQRRLDEARSHLTAALEAFEADPDAHAVLGQLDAEAGRFNNALTHFARVAESATPDGLTSRAWVTALGATQRWDEALFRLDEWEARSPDDTDIPYLRTMALINVGRMEEARSEFTSAVSRAPDHPLRPRIAAGL